MAQIHATRTAHKPASLDATKDMGIPWQTIAAGFGRAGLSHVHEGLKLHDALKAAGSPSFYAVDDAQAAGAGMGRATNAPAAMARNKLAAELHKGAKANLDLVEKFLKELCIENKKTCGGHKPTALHLYMGFDEVDVADRAQAAGLLRNLQAAADQQQGFSKSVECNQMLQWMGEAWGTHAKLLEAGLPQSDAQSARTETVARDDAAGRKRGASQAMTGKESSATRVPKSPRVLELERSPQGLRNAQEILRRAALRDQLLDALQNQDPSAITDALSQIPDGVTDLEKYFPEPVASRSYHGLDRSAKIYTAAKEPPPRSLIAFVHYCQSRENARILMEKSMQEQPDTFLSYELRIRDICTELNRLPEADIESRFAVLALKVKYAHQQGVAMGDHLAEQPFASIESILQKCELLLVHRDSGSVRAFRDAAERALQMRTQAGSLLRDALLKDPMDERKVRKLARKLYAHAMTTKPADHLGGGAPRAQLLSMRKQMQSLLSKWEADDSIDRLNIFALRWLDIDLAKAL